MFKNVAFQKVYVFAYDSTTNAPKTGDAANITAYVAKDFGSATVLGDTSATEVDSTNAKGFYVFDLTQSETNADVLLVTAKSSTSNIVVLGAPATIFTFPTTGILAPATAGRTLVVDANGLADANVVKLGPSGSGTAQTARDIGASVLLSSGTGTGQLKLASGYVAMTWADVAAPTTTVNLSGTTIATTQQVDVNTIKTNPVVNGGTVTFPANATLASTTNITGGTITTVTNLTNAPTAGDLTATMKTSIGTVVAASAVASVTGNVGGDVQGNVNGVVGGVAPDGITGDSLAATAVTAIQSGLSTLTAADVRTAVGLASANLDTQLGDLPTNAELAAALAAADDAVLAAIAAVQADLPQRITKNTALAGFTFLMVSSSDHVTGATGLTVTATRSLDGAAFGACANAVSEVSNGIYKIDLAAADLNANVVTLKFTATGADARFITIATQPT